MAQALVVQWLRRLHALHGRYHLAVTYTDSTSTARVFLDGSEVASGSIPVAPYQLGLSFLRCNLGMWQDLDTCVDMDVKDFRIYSTALR
jgi:hypothetical protein